MGYNLMRAANKNEASNKLNNKAYKDKNLNMFANNLS